jgi:hypothetical protein
MTFFKETKVEKKDTNINQTFFKTKKQDYGKEFSNSALDVFNSIYKFHSSLYNNELFNFMTIKDCHALTLANAIINKLSSENISTDKENSFPESFYNEIAETLINEDEDNTICIINLKQTSNIMKKSKIILVKDNIAAISENFQNRERLYCRLLESFWNGTEWSEIFPSSPKDASKLHEQRDIFATLLLGFYTEVSVEDLSNDFFEITGISKKNNLFMILFVDFYLITWLSYFGIIDYTDKKNTNIVHISIEDYGRDILKSII